MKETKPTRTVRRGRIFPEIQWTEEQQTQWRSALDWVRLERQTMSTARGDFDFYVYVGKIKLDGHEYDIPVHVGQGLPEILLGRQWLINRKLFVHMSSNILTLEN